MLVEDTNENCILCLFTVDCVLVTELLQLRLAPGIDDLVGERGVSGVGACGSGVLLVLQSEVGEARVATNRGNQLVTLQISKRQSKTSQISFKGFPYVRDLRGRDTIGIQPFLEVRLGPGVVEPVTRVRGGLAHLLRYGLVVGADLLENSVTSAGLRYWQFC